MSKGSIWLVALASFIALVFGASLVSHSEDRDSGLDRYLLKRKAAKQLLLPSRMREISGLATSANGRVFAHDDERAIIYQIDAERGKLVKAFAFGDPVARDDFEGLAIAADTFYLVTSAGILYAGAEGEDGAHLTAKRFKTGISKHCNVEGLAFEPKSNRLLLACKQPRTKGGKARVVVEQWSIEKEKLLKKDAIEISLKKLSKGIPGRGFHPSGIARHPASGHYFLITASEVAIAEINPKGEVLEVDELPSSLHSQVEGITFSADLDLLLADEGGGSRGRLTRYR